MNLDFFIPYNKYTQISISITNDSNQKYYQNLRNGCHGITPSHNHEIIIDVKIWPNSYKYGSTVSKYKMPKDVEFRIEQKKIHL